MSLLKLNERDDLNSLCQPGPLPAPLALRVPVGLAGSQLEFYVSPVFSVYVLVQAVGFTSSRL